MNSRKETRRHKKRRKWPFWLGGILLALFLLVGGYAFYLYNQLGSTVASMHTPLERDSDPERQEELKRLFNDKDAVNVLLLGVDERVGDSGRSDTMILVSANPNTDSMKMLSIPRDTYVDIPGYGMDKINHAYAYGGVELSVETVQEAFDLPVHFYARVNMEGFQQGIDALDGVTVQNAQSFSQGGKNFPQGEIHLNGEEALEYIRMRKNDPRGDLGRNERQRQVVTAALQQAASFSSIGKVDDILNILGSNVQTDMDMDILQTLFTGYRGALTNIETLEINGEGRTINGVWYLVVPDSEFTRISAEIQGHMDAK
ncbi:LCP family glycopolymer transferase [Virgibacillus sediminis]|uniref:Polyisoprenyl-teichoic acid--peptidoglycan teichoic acid transferase TagU n=1 Tax=Virgibacillus sediminis TaxID=202260 RepID=A0ABV7A2T7_9BACI